MNVTPKIAHRIVSVRSGSPWATVTSHQPGSTKAITLPTNATARV